VVGLVLGKEHLDTLMSVNGLAGVQDLQGKHEETEVIYRRTLAIKQRVLGLEHSSTLISIINLAALLQHEGRSEADEEMGRRGLRGG